MKTDVLIIGSGVAGLYCALSLPEDKSVTVISKARLTESDSYLAQGGICVLYNDADFDAFFDDTMKAGHYENNPESVRVMINSSREVIEDLVRLGTDFERNEEGFKYTREGAHSRPRILFHKDETGKEITSSLIKAAEKRENITLIENCTMLDIISKSNTCFGAVCQMGEEVFPIYSNYTLLATGGIGGLFEHSTNYPHLEGDALAVAIKNGIKLKDVSYIQIHPTTLYTEQKGRSFLISESVRGEGAILLNQKGERFIDELQPRDVVANGIFAEMEKEGSRFVRLSLEKIPEKVIREHFPNIYERCLKEGIDIIHEPIPVVPAQHYFMGGIEIDTNGKTSMERLYSAGETACNGVHGKNRLASNSLLESLVFARRAAEKISEEYSEAEHIALSDFDLPESYQAIKEEYKKAVLERIERERNSNE